MVEKRKNAFRFRTGFFFGLGFMTAAYSVMWLLDGIEGMAIMVFGIIMRGSGGI